MLIKDVIDENFQDYKKTSMYIAMPKCSWKCCLECGMTTDMCQNSPLAKQPNIEVSNEELINRYMENEITNAIVFGGLEPIDSFDEIDNFLYYFRNIWYCKDDVVIYTGYNENELEWLFDRIRPFGNIIIKCGRYIPNRENRYDEILGVTLASDNQYAIKL